jgi:hypothetical protein
MYARQRMRNPLALSLMFVGLLTLGTSVPPGLVASILTALGFTLEQVAQNAPVVSTAAALTGFGMLVVGTVIMFGSSRQEEAVEPYRKGLQRLATEHGQALESGEGLAFVALREGQPIVVELRPGRNASLTVRSPVKGRQALAFVRPEDAPPDSRALRVGAGAGWELRAELPAIARALMNDPALVAMMDRMFNADALVGVIHDVDGVEVTFTVPSPPDVERRARDGIEIASYLRRVNG